MKGVWTALITPFDSKNEIDLRAFEKILADQKSAKVSGVIPCGTTGESPTLSIVEKQSLIRTAIQFLKGSGVKVFAGTGTNSTAETVELSRWASNEGADGVLIVTPYYNRPTQPGLISHFRAVADSVKCEVMLYNVPGRTGVSLSAQTIATLASHPKIRTIKEASGTTVLTSEIFDALAGSRTSIDVLSGDDAAFVPLLSIGATGIVSVTSNLFPRGMVAIQQAFDAGRMVEVRKLQARYYPLMRDLFAESNPGPIKFAMSRMGWCENTLRLPLVPVSPATESLLETSMRLSGVTRGEPA
jgi:4-hydroxy-tetrahydrodipicolinate synthase